MKHGIYAAAILTAGLALSACGGSVDVEGAHRSWWEAHHHGEAFDHDRAVTEHRDWCGQNKDRSCDGWK